MQSFQIPVSGVDQFVIDMARQHRITYVKTFGDAWGETVTQLADDEVQTDDIENLLIALKRAGKVSAADMLALLVSYLSEKARQHV
jgi:hypothetical protein